ncbi:MAG: ricin-type beta-trefoil lectin domain protein [Acidobacteriaceae bacterium]
MPDAFLTNLAGCTFSCKRLRSTALSLLLLVLCGTTSSVFGAAARSSEPLAPLPPMGWNDWAHYRCGYTAETILANARALVSTGLVKRGYNTVTIDDCWMQKDRDAAGNLQVDPQRFPEGIKPVADAVHALGLKFGIYEDAGYATCGKFAGSGEPDGGGKDHFLQDTRLFASWSVDYLKLDGCNLYVPNGASKAESYRKAYAAQSAALKTAGRPIVFSESAPAYFLDTPDWYAVLEWVREYGQLWREGWDIATFKPNQPDLSRFHSVLWNYAYNLPLGRFQKPGNWNDPDFIIGGDNGMTIAETRSQLALWSMMSAPLILSSDVEKLSPQAIAILGNKDVLRIDQDALGRMATLISRGPVMDVLFKPLSAGDYALAILNRGMTTNHVELHPFDLGFANNPKCTLNGWNLWDGTHTSAASTLKADIGTHDTVIWRVHPTADCGKPARIGAITMIVSPSHHDIDGYSRCLTAPGQIGNCMGTGAESWIVTGGGTVKSGGRCLGVVDGRPVIEACAAKTSQHWSYTLGGNLVNASGKKCLSASDLNNKAQSLALETCGHNQPTQIWSLPN